MFTGLRRLLIGVIAFSGGFVIMSLELLGGRILAPYFGNSIYVWGSIITVFMLSLSAGYLLGGRWSMTSPTLTRLAGICLCAAVLLSPLIATGEVLMEWIFLRVEDPRYGSLLASAVMFVLPTVALGMISPYAISLMVRELREAGHVAGALFFTSTLGSALGTLATSFYLVLWLRVDTILLLLTGMLMVMFVIALLAERAR
jgi:hypothetical protein